MPHHAHIGSTGRDDALGFFADLETFHPVEKKPSLLGGDINVLMEANNVKRSRKVSGMPETVTMLPTFAREGIPKFFLASILSGVLFYIQLCGMHLLGLSSIYILLTTRAAKANPWWYTMHQKRLLAICCQLTVMYTYYHLGGVKMLFALTGAIWLSSNPPPFSFCHFSFYAGDHAWFQTPEGACQVSVSNYSTIMYFMSFGLALHCEHHDFPRIPAHRLHKVRLPPPPPHSSLILSPLHLLIFKVRHIAPEYYKDIKSYDTVWEPIGAYLKDMVRWRSACTSLVCATVCEVSKCE
jgi:hypothetical protein